VDEAGEYPQGAFREATTLGLAGLSSPPSSTARRRYIVIARDLLR
jgi:hypothetical protein